MINDLFNEQKILLRKKHDTEFEDWIKNIPEDFTGVICDTIDRESEGNSGGKPRWVKVYKTLNGKLSDDSKIAIYKEPDYDEPDGPIAEKMYSILGKMVLPNCVLPNIEIVKTQTDSLVPGVLSYCIIDKAKEDMIEIRNILRWNGISEKDMLKNEDRLYPEELLKHIQSYIKDDEQYKKIEGEIIKVILLDCVTNSFDRHPDNWAIVYNHQTGEYKVGLYDNTISFVNMLSSRPGVVLKGNWGKIFIKVKTLNNKDSDNGNDVIKYIHNKYQEYFEEFNKSFISKIEQFCQLIGENENKEIVNNMRNRVDYLKSLDRNEMELEI